MGTIEQSALHNHQEDSGLTNNRRLRAVMSYAQALTSNDVRLCARCAVPLEVERRRGRPRQFCSRCSIAKERARALAKQRILTPEQKAAQWKLDRERYHSDPEYRARRIRDVRRAQAARPLAHKARQLIGQLVKSGKLQPATSFSCTDCASPATDYDHRDYTKPIEVVPVCHRCNILRGPGAPYNT